MTMNEWRYLVANICFGGVLFLSIQTVVSRNVTAGSGLPQCDGTVIDGTGRMACGTESACQGPPNPILGCLGTGVAQELNFDTKCKSGGTPSQHCGEASLTCTRTVYCKEDPVFGVCTFDFANPVLGPDGNPVTSVSSGVAILSCQDQT